MTKPHPCKILCVPINLYLKNVIGDLAETYKRKTFHNLYYKGRCLSVCLSTLQCPAK